MNESISNRNSNINKLQGEYLSSSLNKVWTIDITSVKQHYYFFFVMDLASRRIVGHDVSNHDYTSAKATHIFEKALLLEARVKPMKAVEYVHTDSAGIFLSKDWKELLEANNILVSSSDSKTMQNQVSERFNRTFKYNFRQKIIGILNKKNNKTSTFQLIGEVTKFNFENLITITNEVIIEYNSKKPHQQLNYLAPDNWAFQARQFPDQKYILRKSLSDSESDEDKVIKEHNPIVELKKEIELNKKTKLESLCLKDDCNLEIEQKEIEIKDDKSYLLKDYEIVPFNQLSKNDNSLAAKEIRHF